MRLATRAASAARIRLAVLAAVPCAALIAPAAADAGTYTFAPTADTYSRSDTPTTTYGSSVRVSAQSGSQTRRAYLQFAVTVPSGEQVTASRLELHTLAAGDSKAVELRGVADNSWSEGSLTWNNQPSTGSTVASSRSSYANGVYVSWDASSLVKAAGTVGLALTTTSTAWLGFDSKEAASSVRPRLVVETAMASSPTATPTATPVAAPPTPTSTATPTPSASPAPTPGPLPSGGGVIAAAGDIAAPQTSAGATSGGQWATDDLLDQIQPNAVIGLGDYVYEYGYLASFEKYYASNWGRFKDITRAINGGGHDFYGGGDYYSYFGSSAGPAPYSSYSWDLSGWHMIAVNNYCSDSHVGGCGVGSSAYEWLKGDLAAHPNKCTLVYWHQPYWTSGSSHAPYTAVKDMMQLMYNSGVDVLLQAHNHQYERFAPQDPTGRRDDARGIQAFVVGTGGRSFYGFNSTPAANSLVRNNTTFGVLKMNLATDGWAWKFMPVAGQTFTDSGSASCH